MQEYGKFIRERAFKELTLREIKYSYIHIVIKVVCNISAPNFKEYNNLICLLSWFLAE